MTKEELEKIEERLNKISEEMDYLIKNIEATNELIENETNDMNRKGLLENEVIKLGGKLISLKDEEDKIISNLKSLIDK